MTTRSFLAGVTFGIFVSVSVFHYKSTDSNNAAKTYIHKFLHEEVGDTSYNEPSASQIDKDDNTTADQLYHKVRILCWIMTSPNTLQSRAKYVRDSWSRRCNIRLFMSSVADKNFPTVGLPVMEGRDQLYEKTKEAYKYVWKHYRDKADWFLKADDDTFMVVENLRFLLKDYDPKTPIYFGKRKMHGQKEFMGGGAGYVLSKEATRRFVNGLETKCPKGTGIEDMEIGKCMTLLGVESGDSRDDQLKERFYPISAAEALVDGYIKNGERYKKHNYYETCLGNEKCFSPYLISFHRAYGPDMIIYDYLIKAKVYGMGHYYKQYQKLPYER